MSQGFGTSTGSTKKTLNRPVPGGVAVDAEQVQADWLAEILHHSYQGLRK